MTGSIMERGTVSNLVFNLVFDLQIYKKKVKLAIFVFVFWHSHIFREKGGSQRGFSSKRVDCRPGCMRPLSFQEV